MALISKKEFVRDYSQALFENSASAFIGAGFSVGAGFVDWKTLLHDIADDLGLAIDEEHDLIAVAQYEFNKSGSRDRLENKVVREFVRTAHLTPSHEWLARLPLETVWTTNYDTLLEQAFQNAKKTIDVKITVSNLQHLRPYTDVTIYKMHGDVSQPDTAVLTKDDYESYDTERGLFTHHLRNELLYKSFLFAGFSFSDPNVEYTLIRLRRLLGKNAKSQKRHFCIMRRPQQSTDPDLVSSGKFDRAKKRFEHRVADLQRLGGVQVVAIDNYSEMEPLLKEICHAVNTRNVMISGSAQIYEPMGKERVELLCQKIGRGLIEHGFNIVSGFGLGISGAIIIGAYEQISKSGSGRLGQRLRLYPFPYDQKPSPEKVAAYEAIRNEMVSQAGATIFICGNKQNPADGKIVNSPGVRKELEMCIENEHILIPISCTEYASREIWNKVKADQSRFYGKAVVDAELNTLGNETSTDDDILNAVLSILNKYNRARTL